ncbi:MAG: 5-formyltetrahydrofolate cyclo-ligase [Chloroflexi bacterium]|nr:5-formyltetrahydrofolate cyclo-ligase [Chloroflexota bacterium]
MTSREDKSSSITELILGLPEYQQATVIMAYVSFGSEVATSPLIEHALACGKRVVLPIVAEGRVLLLGEIDHLSGLRPGPSGILEPDSDSVGRITPDELDFIIVPGVVFDAAGRRIGYGGGYYDRFFELVGAGPVKTAVAFEIQLVENVPAESHDKYVDIIVTESGVIRCL